VVVLALAGPDWPRWLGVRRASASSVKGGIERSASNEALLRRIAAKDQVTDRLLAGDLTLLQAAAWFRRLNDDPPHLPTDYSKLPGESEEEKVCRQVIAWAGHRLGLQGVAASEADGTVRRLEDELDGRLRRDGRVELPW
jgi:hypothetical protein